MLLRLAKVLMTQVMLVVAPGIALAQSAVTTPQQAEQALLKPAQLEALVAPIALYPDALLANVLAASTYPLEVVQADRWLKERKQLKGDQLKAEVDKQSWDDSIKALAATPTVITMMSDKLDWSKALGDAVLAQQPDVMDAIQRLRLKAQQNNKLTSTKEQKVSIQQQEGKQVIVIEPTDPNTVYVPYYEPAIVYGEWPYPDYPPYYFGYPSYIGAGVITTGLAFGAGYALGRWSRYWGGGCHWGNNNFFINRSNVGKDWQHNPAHRQGVRYSNANVQQRFGNNNLRAGSADRMDFRGRGGEQVLNPAKDRGAAGERTGTERRERASSGDRGGDRTGARERAAADRQGKADRGERAGGKQAKSADRARASGAGSRGNRDSALDVQSGRAAKAQSARGRASYASAGASRGAISAGPRGGGGSFRGGGGGGFRGGGGGRRSDLALKHNVVLLGRLDNGLGYYRFSYLGSDKAYVGVIAQEVQAVRPDAVTRGRDGYLRVYYDKLGIKFRSYRDWLAAGARIPTGR